MMFISRILFTLVLLCSLASTATPAGNEPINTLPVQSNNQPTASFMPDLRTFLNNEDAARYARMFGPFIVSGGTHGAIAGMTSPSFATESFDNTGNHIIQASATINYQTVGCADDDIAWVIISSRPENALDNFQRVSGTDYFVDCVSVTQPVLPSGAAWLMRVPLVAGSIIAPEPLLSHSPLDFSALDATVYATQHGFVCDGVADNSAALVAAHDALPPTGGILVLPAAASPCIFSTTFTPTKHLVLRGAGMRPVGGSSYTPLTVLQYTGSDAAIRLTGSAVQGSRLEGFQLDHSGTATVGIDIDVAANMVMVHEVSIESPSVPFSDVGIRVRNTSNVHSTVLSRVHLNASAPTGVRINGTLSYTKILHSRILEHTIAGVEIGPNSPSRDTIIASSDISNAGTGGVGVLITRADFVLITDSHLEISGGGYGVSIPNTANAAQNVRVVDSFINCLANCLAPIHVNLLGADLLVERNTLLNNSGGTAVAYVDNVLARATIVRANKLLDTLVPTVTSLVRTYVSQNVRTGEPRGIVDGFGPQRLCIDSTIVGNVGAGDDVLYTCSIPANTLWIDNMGLRLRVWGVTASNGNNKTIRIYLGATQIFIVGPLAANGDTWIIDCTGIRSGANAMRIACNGGVYDVDPTISGEFNGVIATAWSASQNLTVTGEATADNDISTRGLYVETLY